MKTKRIGQSKLCGPISIIYPHNCLESVHPGKPHTSQTQQTPLQLKFPRLWPQGRLWVSHSAPLGNKPSPLCAHFLANQSLWAFGFSLRFIFIIFKLCVSVDEHHGGGVTSVDSLWLLYSLDGPWLWRQKQGQRFAKNCTTSIGTAQSGSASYKKKCWFGNMQIWIL